MLRQTRLALGHQQAIGNIPAHPRRPHPARNHLPHRLVPRASQRLWRRDTLNRNRRTHHQYRYQSRSRCLPASLQPCHPIMIMPNNKLYLSISSPSIMLELQQVIPHSRLLRKTLPSGCEFESLLGRVKKLEFHFAGLLYWLLLNFCRGFCNLWLFVGIQMDIFGFQVGSALRFALGLLILFLFSLVAQNFTYFLLQTLSMTIIILLRRLSESFLFGQSGLILPHQSLLQIELLLGLRSQSKVFIEVQVSILISRIRDCWEGLDTRQLDKLRSRELFVLAATALVNEIV